MRPASRTRTAARLATTFAGAGVALAFLLSLAAPTSEAHASQTAVAGSLDGIVPTCRSAGMANADHYWLSVYAHASDQEADGPRGGHDAARALLAFTNKAFIDEAAKPPTPTFRGLRTVCDASGVPVVLDVLLPNPIASYSYLTLMDAVRAAGQAAGHPATAKYMVWTDRPFFDTKAVMEGAEFFAPGIGETTSDSRPGPENRVNGNGDGRIVVATDVLSGRTALHEALHAMGAVLAEAASSDGAGHCVLQGDVMCYPNADCDRIVDAEWLRLNDVAGGCDSDGDGVSDFDEVMAGTQRLGLVKTTTCLDVRDPRTCTDKTEPGVLGCSRTTDDTGKAIDACARFAKNGKEYVTCSGTWIDCRDDSYFSVAAAPPFGHWNVAGTANRYWVLDAALKGAAKSYALDRDSDGLPDYRDLCPDTRPHQDDRGIRGKGPHDPEQAPFRDGQWDNDADGTPGGTADTRKGGNECDTDDDNDGVLDGADNCPYTANAGQQNNDAASEGSARVGDACDGDDDNDTVPDFTDNCPFKDNASQSDGNGVLDGDGIGDACEAPDQDLDGVPDATDNCVYAKNPSQADLDGDRRGDACDDDRDGDGDLDAADNCPDHPNADQRDADGDQVGNACDPSPNAQGWRVAATDGVYDGRFRTLTLKAVAEVVRTGTNPVWEQEVDMHWGAVTTTAVLQYAGSMDEHGFLVDRYEATLSHTYPAGTSGTLAVSVTFCCASSSYTGGRSASALPIYYEDDEPLGATTVFTIPANPEGIAVTRPAIADRGVVCVRDASWYDRCLMTAVANHGYKLDIHFVGDFDDAYPRFDGTAMTDVRWDLPGYAATNAADVFIAQLTLRSPDGVVTSTPVPVFRLPHVPPPPPPPPPPPSSGCPLGIRLGDVSADRDATGKPRLSWTFNPQDLSHLKSCGADVRVGVYRRAIERWPVYDFGPLVYARALVWHEIAEVHAYSSSTSAPNYIGGADIWQVHRYVDAGKLKCHSTNDGRSEYALFATLQYNPHLQVTETYDYSWIDHQDTGYYVTQHAVQSSSVAERWLYRDYDAPRAIQALGKAPEGTGTRVSFEYLAQQSTCEAPGTIEGAMTLASPVPEHQPNMVTSRAGTMAANSNYAMTFPAPTFYPCAQIEYRITNYAQPFTYWGTMPSSTVTGTQAPGAPLPPKVVSASVDPNAKTLKLQWQSPDYGCPAASYRIEVDGVAVATGLPGSARSATVPVPVCRTLTYSVVATANGQDAYALRKVDSTWTMTHSVPAPVVALKAPTLQVTPSRSNAAVTVSVPADECKPMLMQVKDTASGALVVNYQNTAGLSHRIDVTVPNLVPCRSYAYAARASRDFAGDTGFGASVAFQTTSLPPYGSAKPTASYSTALHRTSLTWTAPSADCPISSYVVERRVAGTSSWTTSATTASPSFTDTALRSCTSYEYRVTAIDSRNVRGLASPVTDQVHTRRIAPPLPANLAASPNGDPMAGYTPTLTWERQADDGCAATSLKVEQRVATTSTWTHVATLPLTTTQATMPAVGGCQDMHYRVTYDNTHGSAPALAMVSGTDLVRAESAPALTAYQPAPGVYTPWLDWTDVDADPGDPNTCDVKEYWLYRSVSPDMSGAKVMVFPAGTLTHRDDSAVPGVRYYYQVTAWTPSWALQAESLRSNQVQAGTADGSGLPVTDIPTP